MDDKYTILEPFSGLNVLNPFKGLSEIERDIAYELIWYKRNENSEEIDGSIFTKKKEYHRTHLRRHSKVPTPESYYEKVLRMYNRPAFSRTVSLYEYEDGTLYYDVGEAEEYGPNERYINQEVVKTNVPKELDPQPYRPENVEYEIARMGGCWFFGGVGYFGERDVLTREHINTNNLVSYMTKPFRGNWITAFIGNEIRKLECNFTETEKIESFKYNATIVTFVGDYEIFSKYIDYRKDGVMWGREINCDRVLIPGIYGITREYAKLCYLEIIVPSFYSEGTNTEATADREYRVNPSEFMIPESEVITYRTRIHKTNHVIRSGILYYANSIHKKEFLGYRTIPIYVNKKGEDDMGYSPRLRPLNLKAHLMDRFAMNQLNTEMWSTNTMKKMLDLYNVDGSTIANRLLVSTKEAGKHIVSSKWFFGLNEKSFGAGDMVRKSEKGVVRLGMLNVPLRVPFYDVDDETATLVETTFNMNEIEKDSLEYGGTSYDLFLPYYGYVALNDVHEYDRLSITLRANIVTGVGTWMVEAEGRFIVSVECQVGLDVPIQASKNENLVDKSLNSIAAPITKAVGGSILGTLGGNFIKASASMESPNGYGASVTSSSGPDGILNGMNKIFITVKRPELYDGSGFSGYDILEKGIMGTFHKYVKAKDVNKESFGGIPKWAVEEIETKLMEGVYINR